MLSFPVSCFVDGTARLVNNKVSAYGVLLVFSAASALGSLELGPGSIVQLLHRAEWGLEYVRQAARRQDSLLPCF